MSEASQHALTVTFWGVRGSFPTAGARTVVFGGNTPCVEVRVGGRLFIIDAGTGIIGLGRAIAAGAPAVVDILLSHLHLDHTQGLPFFAPAFAKERTIRTWLGNLDGQSAGKALGQIFAPPLFPVTLDAFPCRFEHHGFRAGEPLQFEDGIEIATLPLKHPSGATAYRFDHGGRRVCYVSDIEHEAPWPPPALQAFCRGTDLLIYDAMYTAGEYERCVGWGHSTIEAGVALCEASGACELAIFHHNPAHDDATLAGREDRLKALRPNSSFAREGETRAYAAVAAKRTARAGKR